MSQKLMGATWMLFKQFTLFNLPLESFARLQFHLWSRLRCLFMILLLLSGQAAYGYEGPTGLPRTPIPAPPLPAADLSTPDPTDKKREKYDELKENIDRLGQLLRQKQLQSQHRSQPSLDTLEPSQSVTETDITSPDATLRPPSELAAPMDSLDVVEPTFPRDSVSGQQEQSDNIDSTVTYYGEVDRLALAASLFADGQFEQCLQTLEELRAHSLSEEDLQWRTFLQAGCLRSLGMTDEAKRLYRKLVTADPKSWLGNYSAWWIDEMGERERLQLELQQLTVSLEQWKVEIDGMLQHE